MRGRTSCRGGGRTCRPADGAPARCWRCSPTTSPARSSPPPSSSGSPPAPTRHLRAAVVPARAAGRPRDPPHHRRRCSASTSPGPASRELVQATLDLVRGLGLANTISDDTARRRRILDRGPAPSTTSCDDCASERDEPARRRARRPRRRGRRSSRRWWPTSTTPAGARRRRPPAGTSPPRSRTWPGPTRSRVAAATDKDGLGRARARRRSADPEGYVDAEALAGAQAAPRRDPRPLARGAAGAAAALRGSPPARSMPWFGPPMSADLDGDRPVHGDLGARARRRRRARRRPAEPTDRIRHVAHLGVRTRDFAFGVHGLEPPAEEFRVELDRAVGRGVGRGGPTTRRSRCAARRTTSACWSPSAATATTSTWCADGADADHWLDIAQAFAGPPGQAGRRAR